MKYKKKDENQNGWGGGGEGKWKGLMLSRVNSILFRRDWES